MIAALVAAAGLVVGCAKKAPGSAAPDASTGYAGAAAEEAPAEDASGGDTSGEPSLDELELSLAGYEDELLAAGVSLDDDVIAARTESARDSTPAAAGSLTGDRCTKVCKLSETICELGDRICSLADEHVQETRYQRACSRVELDCERATEACDGCKD